jgi:hypothetical protein
MGRVAREVVGKAAIDVGGTGFERDSPYLAGFLHP